MAATATLAPVKGIAEHVHVEQRRRRAGLVQGEQADEDDPAGEGGERDAVQPAVAPAADDAVDERAEPHHRQRRFQRVQPSLLGSRDSGTAARPTRAMATMGRFTRKIDPQ